MKMVWISLGFISLALGTIGVVLPLLPTVPFYMATVFCFAKSSRKLYDWFVGTKLYRRYLESYVTSRAMTVKNKLAIMGTATAVMAVGFLMMSRVPVGRICIAVVWVFHVIYFSFAVKTIREEKEECSGIIEP